MTKPNPQGGRRTAQAQLRRLRREAGRSSLATFARTYLANHFTLQGSRMHAEMLDCLEQASKTRNARLAIAAPRGHAKSTIVSLACVLWSIVYEIEPFIILISNTGDQAADLVATVKSELELNTLLVEDFPEAAEPAGARPTRSRWRRSEIITRNQVRVLALGAGQKIRGRKHREHRPSLIILDDIENDVDVQSADLRDTTLGWFHKSVMKAGTTDHTNVVVVGTILHYDSLLAQLLREPGVGQIIPGWETMKYQAVIAWAEQTHLWEEWASIYSHRELHEDASGPGAARAFFEVNRDDMLEASEVLWPEREDYYQLMELRLREGSASFDSEKQNEPIDRKTCFFDPDTIQYWDDQYATTEALLADLGSQSRIFGACDPSLGREGKNRDNTAIVVILEHKPTRILYVLDADIRKRRPLDTINAIIEYHRVRDFDRLCPSGKRA